ncbi:MAG: hypothetical protein IPK80_04875 [Nannocystis sp.]|nr:hypothetical protein [Nannocystis sp.]
MIPVTHAFYLATGLLLVGLAGALLLRPRLQRLLALQLIFLGAHLALVTAARIWALHDGHAFALVTAALALTQLAITAPLALHLLPTRRPGP